MSNHIKPPYSISGEGKAICLTAIHDGDEIIVAIASPLLDAAERPTLEFIQNACNNYDPLILACRLALVRLTGGNVATQEFNRGIAEAVRKAIQDAEQGKLSL